MKTAWCAVFFVVLVACSPSTVVVTPTNTHPVLSTNTPTRLSSTTSEIIPSQAAMSPTSITPKVKIIAPDVREVEFSALELNDSTRLILYYEPSDSLRIMAREDVRPQRIPINNSQSILSYGIQISPNQKWFLYKVFKEMRDVAYYDIWISSIDGKNQKLAISDVRGASEARWVTNEQVELWYHPDGARACPEIVLVVNPFTQDTFTPHTIPASSEPQCFFPLSTSPDRTKLIYRNKDAGMWNIYDLNTGDDQLVFPWLSESSSFTLWPNYVRWVPSGITYVLPNQESIDFALDLSPASATNVDGKWDRVLLPQSRKILWNTFPWISLDNGLIGFDMIDAQTNPLGSSDETPPSTFVILDLRSSTLYDYDLDRARIGDMQRVSDYFVKASADNRFLAWTISRPPGMGNPIETVVLDRLTGQIARIKGFEFWGWGEIGQP